MKKVMLLASAAALVLTGAAAFAQDKGKAKTPAPARTAISIECSKQADAKGLHGKARHSFRAKCKRDAAKTTKSKV